MGMSNILVGFNRCNDIFTNLKVIYIYTLEDGTLLPPYDSNRLERSSFYKSIIHI